MQVVAAVVVLKVQPEHENLHDALSVAAVSMDRLPDLARAVEHRQDERVPASVAAAGRAGPPRGEPVAFPGRAGRLLDRRRRISWVALDVLGIEQLDAASARLNESARR